MRGDVDLCAFWHTGQNVANLIWRVGPLHRSDAVYTRDIAAHQWKAGVDQRQVQRMPDEVVDDESVSAHSQCLTGKLAQLVRLKVVREQTATHHVEAAIAKRKGECVSDKSTVLRTQVRRHAIKVCDIESDTAASKL